MLAGASSAFASSLISPAQATLSPDRAEADYSSERGGLDNQESKDCDCEDWLHGVRYLLQDAIGFGIRCQAGKVSFLK